MCIAIRKPASAHIPRATLERCFDANSHGAGFAVLTEEGILVRKGFMDFRSFWKAWKPFAHHFALLHFRIATCGPRNASGTHPWSIEAGGFQYAVIHNGHLTGLGDAVRSDTQEFVEDVLRPILDATPDLPFEDAGHQKLCRVIGPYNKLVILRNDGRVAIINKRRGVTDRGVWYSNTSFLGDFKAAVPVRSSYNVKARCTDSSFPDRRRIHRVPVERVDDYFQEVEFNPEADRAQQLLLDQAVHNATQVGPRHHGPYSLPPYVRL